MNSLRRAFFIQRLNRFTLTCRLGRRIVKAFLPNPGRLWELLLPGSTLLLERARNPGHLPYIAVAVMKEGHPVMIHTHRTNDLALSLLEEDRVPGLEGFRVVRKEVPEGRSRFDFLLQRGKDQILLEVKSCTLFGREVAMFPDAVTARGKRHLDELSALAQRGGPSGAVLFLIFRPEARFFLPDYHTDLEFARSLKEARKWISIFPLALRLEENLSLTPPARLVEIPWEILEREAEDRGSYLLLLHLARETGLEIGSLGRLRFRKGHYLYVGSARNQLSARLERHRRLGKNHFWHIDFLRTAAELRCALAIRTADDLECALARGVQAIAHWEVERFGSSDCGCPAHLFGMSADPLQYPPFLDLLQHFRMDRLFPSGR